MRIGIKPDIGESGKLNKWYFGIDFLRCPPSQVGIFRPSIFIWCVKWLDHGEPGMFNGRPEKRKGHWKEFNFPWGIRIEIIKF